jgi:hypothetical protein
MKAILVNLDLDSYGGGGARIQYLIRRCTHRRPMDLRPHHSTVDPRHQGVDPMESLAVARVQVAAACKSPPRNL